MLLIILLFTACNQNSEPRKIKLSQPDGVDKSNRRFTSTIHLEPTLRRAIAIMFFENTTGDQKLEWLQKGLTEMLIRSLSQSRSLSVLSTDQLFSILDSLDQDDSAQPIDVNLAAVVAREARVEALLTGKIAKNGDSLQITVQVHEPTRGQILTQETVEGPGLESIFAMVDDLTQKIRQRLQIALEQDASSIADLSTHSLDAWRHYSLGLDLMKKAMLNDAISEFERATAFDANFVSAYYHLCLLLANQGERGKLQTYLPQLQTLKAKASPREQYQIERLEGSLQRDIRKTIDASKRWLEHNPEDAEANFNLGDIFFSLQNYEEAIQYYRATTNIDPGFKPAYNMIGYCYARKGDIPNAIATMKQYQKLAPKEPNPYDSMGEIYYSQGDYRRAEKQFKKALKLNDSFAPSWLSLGAAFLDQGQFDAATQAYRQFLDKAKDPRSRSAGLFDLGTTQWRLGEKARAIASLQEIVGTQVNSYRAITWVNELYLEAKDSVAARTSLQENYDTLKNVVLKESFYLNELANLSLTYNLNGSTTIDVIRQILKQPTPPGVRRRAQFYLSLLYLKSQQIAEYQEIADDFFKEFSQILLDSREALMGYETWRKFSIFNSYAYQARAEGVEMYQKFIQFCQQHDLAKPEMLFRLFLTDLYLNQGDSVQAREQLQMVGMPEESKWLVVAPFDNTDGFRKKYSPEREIKLNKIYQEYGTQQHWQSARDGFNDGYINLKQIHTKYNWSVAYGLLYVRVPKNQTVQIRLGTNDAVKLWVNDDETWRMNVGRDAIFDNDVVPVILRAGLNKILIKVCNRINEWGFYLRITNANGQGLPELEFVSANDIN